MDAIVAVYDDWGIGCDGDQPIALSADRKFFRRTTQGAAVIVGRKTLQAFPGGNPLPNRRNIVLTRKEGQIPGVQIARSVEQALELVSGEKQVFVIGGGAVYRQLLPSCRQVYVTKVHVCPTSDTWFEDLDASDQWRMEEVMTSGEENGIRYEMCRYVRV